jgi:hypothetical protein
MGGFGWKLGVSLRQDGDIGWFIVVALSGSFLSLEHGAQLDFETLASVRNMQKMIQNTRVCYSCVSTHAMFH